MKEIHSFKSSNSKLEGKKIQNLTMWHNGIHEIQEKQWKIVKRKEQAHLDLSDPKPLHLTTMPCCFLLFKLAYKRTWMNVPSMSPLRVSTQSRKIFREKVAWTFRPSLNRIQWLTEWMNMKKRTVPANICHYSRLS